MQGIGPAAGNNNVSNPPAFVFSSLAVDLRNISTMEKMAILRALVSFGLWSGGVVSAQAQDGERCISDERAVN